MALMKGKDIPKDAVVLDEQAATEYIWNLVNDWQPSSDVWALRYTPIILGGVNAVSGIVINRFYRQKLKLGTYGYFASVIPITAMPAFLTALFHRYLITTDMLLMKRETCPVCYEVRSAAIQVGIGFVYPMIIGPWSGLMLANRYNTARIPDLREGPKVTFQFLRKMTKPLTGTLTFLLLGQLAASSVLTYFEMKSQLTIKKKMMAIEAKLMAKEGS